ncbi:MAG: MgtC/SapB family protein [Dehalococcoidales bacterium]|jgi:putative Mg2+ transporter-C (MgtC) family protein|nr:MgtC/SapB family protein [Dehalococcoidales bacterium]MDD3264705.1 MgtC/SapB family protein [Dehalococcoidales bacterium]MDD4322316.1 MgtC/SapB family protein [Dehalococcoidales bacterium]MDD4793944.1 MgtC/SapB family protein [Dehalococcoidales bacterium]MDD5122282.1 MgtC/SapB family protein [Dehalococcoidales bacterium]
MWAEVEIILRLVLAAVLGGVIGFERWKAGKPAGVRDLALISLGSAIFTVVSSQGFAGGDPSRIAAGIVTGIGFIGAGAILHRDSGGVKGLTTATSIWIAAGIGIAVGAGLYYIALAATVIALAVLLVKR